MWLKLSILLLFCAFAKSDDHVGSGTCEYLEIKSRRFTGYLCKMQHNNAEVITEIGGNHLEGKVNDDVAYVSASNLSIKILTPIFCEQYKNIHRMSIFKTDIEKVEPNALESCWNVQFLEFNSNKVTEIPETMFAKNTKLWLIKLARNRLITLPENIFSNLPDLLKLFIYDNQITYLPHNIFKSNKKLTLIDLSRNRLTTLNSYWFSGIPDLYYLNLDTNQILDLPKDAFVNQQKLELIWLGNNNLTVIHSDSFGINMNFSQLYVQNNSINAIDERLINNTAIRKFDMTANVCSQDDINNRFQLKDAFQKCYDNYKPREA